MTSQRSCEQRTLRREIPQLHESVVRTGELAQTSRACCSTPAPALQKDDKSKAQCLSTAQMFYAGTTLLGCGPFESSQKEACQCVDDPEAAARVGAKIKKNRKEAATVNARAGSARADAPSTSESQRPPSPTDHARQARTKQRTPRDRSAHKKEL